MAETLTDKTEPARAVPVWRGQGLVFILITAVCLLGWAWLGLIVGAMSVTTDMNTLGPGMEAVNWLSGVADLPEGLRDVLLAICATDGSGHFGMPADLPWTAIDLFLVFVMWLAMVLAMMLPSATPMILAFHAAGRDVYGDPVRRTVYLTLGYLAVWTGFAVVATGVQWGLTAAAWMSPEVMAPLNLVVAGTTLVGAGLYQFTPTKHACLMRCQAASRGRFGALVAADAAPFRLGLQQGLLCAGCCWALMAVMFAVGVMNVLWIAILAIALTAEKTLSTPRLPLIIGAILIAWGSVVLLAVPGVQNAIGL